MGCTGRPRGVIWSYLKMFKISKRKDCTNLIDVWLSPICDFISEIRLGGQGTQNLTQFWPPRWFWGCCPDDKVVLCRRKLQSDMKATRIDEMQVQLEAFYTEIIRLQQGGTSGHKARSVTEVKSRVFGLNFRIELNCSVSEKSMRRAQWRLHLFSRKRWSIFSYSF